MFIRNRTTKEARRAVKTTGRGATPANGGVVYEPRRGDRLFCRSFRAQITTAICRGCTPACNLWPILGLGGIFADNHFFYADIYKEKEWLKERTTHHRTSGKSTSLLILFLLFFYPSIL
jgi:hypothetical protein